MADFLRRHGILITSLLLLFLSFQLMSMSVRNRSLPQMGTRAVSSLLFPLEKLNHELSESAKYVWRHYVYLLGVEGERNELKERITELEAQNSKLMEFESENQRLRDLLGFVEQTNYRGVAASVVGRDPSNWIKTVTIDRGWNDGVRPGVAVVDGHAIVGQTIAVTKQSAKVLLLTDSASAVDAIVQSNRATGIVEGGLGHRKLKMRYVEKLLEAPVRPGDRIIASGLDGVFPKGTLIGVAERADVSGGGLFQVIEVKPSVDVTRIENVLVLIGPAGSKPDASAPEIPVGDTPAFPLSMRRPPGREAAAADQPRGEG